MQNPATRPDTKSMNAPHYSINAGLYGEFYVVLDGEKILPRTFPTFLAASEFIAEVSR